MSNSIKNIPKSYENKISLVNENVSKVINDICKQGFSNIYIDGGTVVKDCLQNNILDEIIITRIPITIGKGIPLFPVLNYQINFKHISTKVINNFMVQSHYKIIKN